MNLILTRTFPFILLSCLLIADTAKATVYETIQSGNYSSSNTWKNGMVPPVNLGATDTVFFKAAAPSITLDKNIVMTHSNCYVEIESPVDIADQTNVFFIAVQQGYIMQQSGSKIEIDSLYYSGNVNVNSLMGGTVTVNSLTLSSAIYKAGTTRPGIKHLLHFVDGVSSINTQFKPYKEAALYFSNNGGVKGSSAVDLSEDYYLKYGNTNTASGSDRFDELQGNNIVMGRLLGVEIDGNITLDVTPGTLYLRDELKMTSGFLKLVTTSSSSTGIYFQEKGRFSDAGTALLYGSDSLSIAFNSHDVNGLGKVKFATGYERLSNLNFWLLQVARGTLTVENDLMVKNQLSLGTGSINIGNHHLSVGYIDNSNYGSKDSYVKMDQGGKFSMDVLKYKNYVFPIGTPTNFLPLKVTADNFNQATVAVVEGVKEFGTTGKNVATTEPVVNATWILLDSTAVSNIAPGWLQPSEVNGFTRNSCYVSTYTATGWDRTPARGITGTSGYFETPFRAQLFKGGVYAVFAEDNTVAVAELTQDDNSVTIYPNPATDKLHLDYDAGKKLTATVYDVTGKLLITSELSNGTNTIDVSALQSGVYILNISGDGVETSHRFVKE